MGLRGQGFRLREFFGVKGLGFRGFWGLDLGLRFRA